MFDITNQLLAAVALCVGTTVIINSGRARYAWTTLVPLTFVAITTLYAGWLSIFNNFLPLTKIPAKAFAGYLDTTCTAILMACVIVILISSARAWRRAMRGEPVSLVMTPSHSHVPGSGCC
jgi:carbon starvation protein